MQLDEIKVEDLKPLNVVPEKIDAVLKEMRETPYGGLFPLSSGLSFRHPVLKIKNLWRDLKVIRHRAKWSWSYYDCWDLDNWFLKVIPQMLDALVDNACGYKLEIWKNGENVSIENPKEYYTFVRELADEFRMANESFYDEIFDYDFIAMPYKEREKHMLYHLNRAMDNFAHNFYGFWD